MNESANKAVFLSYASQDAAVARRICEALRAGGIEVWFDADGGLEHGDEWDAKIRRQIKECILFIPVISAATQAREEGYFRIEWDLAAERARGIASGVAFILPVVIDGTRESDALVPDRFRAVQWTRLADGLVPPEVQQRFVKLWSHRAGVLSNEADPRRALSRAATSAGSPVQERKPVARTWIAVAIATCAVGLGAFFAWRAQTDSPEKAAATTTAQAAAAGQAATTWPRDPELNRVIDLVNSYDGNPEDFVLAEEIAGKVLAKNSTDLEAVTVMARVHAAYIYRGFDRSDERRASARRFGERAVQLGPKDPEALGSLGVCLVADPSGDLDRAVELLDRAIALRPEETFLHRHRNSALFLNPKVPKAESLAAVEKTAIRFPSDPLAHYDVGRRYRDLGRTADMERAFDRCIALAPIAGALMWKAHFVLWGRGDLAETKALIDRVPARTRAGERVVVMRWAYAMASGQTADALEGLDALTAKWVEDFTFNGPKSLLAAQLLERVGKRELARLQYESALIEVRARQARAPTNVTLRETEAWILHGLGRDEEARPLSRLALEAVPRPYRYGALLDWWFTSIPRCLLTGDREIAVQLLREAATDESRAPLRMNFKLDPRMATFRDDQEIMALIAEPVK